MITIVNNKDIKVQVSIEELAEAISVLSVNDKIKIIGQMFDDEEQSEKIAIGVAKVVEKEKNSALRHYKLAKELDDMQYYRHCADRFLKRERAWNEIASSYTNEEVDS